MLPSVEEGGEPCKKLHFKRVISGNTDPTFGDCSYLDTCRHEKCHFVHYELDTEGAVIVSNPTVSPSTTGENEAQWLQCDIRKLDFGILGRFGVVLADPPWDIHMTLPYGTMTDDEMKRMNVQCLMTEGMIFMWVTGRSMELGRECLELWGYRVIEEIVWIKTNQLQRVIRTGRTGHWMNHSKEHLLVGMKGNPLISRMMDCDVIVSEVRAMSQKPDEVYSLIDRLMSPLGPNARKLELFGRRDNLHSGWLTLGNQLGGSHIVEPCILDAIAAKYGDIRSVPGVI